MSRVDSKVRRALAITAAAALALGLAACSGSGGSGTKTVVWSTWGTPEELTRYKEFDTEFMKQHPDIKVVLQPVADYGDYHTKLLAQLASRHRSRRLLHRRRQDRPVRRLQGAAAADRR